MQVQIGIDNGVDMTIEKVDENEVGVLIEGRGGTEAEALTGLGTREMIMSLGVMMVEGHEEADRRTIEDEGERIAVSVQI